MRKDSLREKRDDRPRVRLKSEFCDHKYVWIETVRQKKEKEHGLIEFILTDRFYCTNCLDIQERTKSAEKDPAHDLPGWY